MQVLLEQIFSQAAPNVIQQNRAVLLYCGEESMFEAFAVLSTCLFIAVLDVVGPVSFLGENTRESGRCLVPDYEITYWLAWLWDSACGKRRRAYPAALM